MHRLKKVCLKLVMPLLFFIIFTTVFSSGQPLKTSISESNIKSHLYSLTSPEYEGRLIGTKGNEKVLDYIEDQFKDIGLHSLTNESYRQEFKAVNFTWNGVPRFNVIESDGKFVDSYEEQKNFMFIMDNMSIGGSFKGQMNHITDAKEINKSDEKFKNQAVLIDYVDNPIKKLRLSDEEIDHRLYYLGKAKVIIYLDHNFTTERKVHLGDKNTVIPTNGIIKIGVPEDTYKELLDYTNQGYLLDIDIPITFQEVSSSNIYGVLPGKNYPNGDYLVIATSIDGLGLNWDGKDYPGAADNGASISLMLELARALSNTEKHLDSNLLFAGFNGKHTGSMGVEQYLRDSMIFPEKSEIIYLDQLSPNGETPLKIATFSKPRTEKKIANKVLHQLAATADGQNISYELDDGYLQGEYYLFRNFGMIASTLTYGHIGNIGTALDTADHITLSKVVEVGALLQSYLTEYGQFNLFLQLSSVLKSMWWFIVIGIVLVILKYGISDKKGFEKLKQWFDLNPVISIYLLILFFISTLTMQIQHYISETEGILLKDTIITWGSIVEMFAHNIFTTLPMLAYLGMVIVIPISLVFLILMYLSKKLNKNLYVVLMLLSTYTVFMKFFNQFYDDRYTVIYPKLLSPHGFQYIVIFLILLFSLLVTWTLNRKTHKISDLKSTVIFLLLFIILTTFTYSPYVFAKEVVSVRSVNGRLKL